MGAVTFSLDPRLVAAIRSAIPLTVLVETGTFQGDTVAAFLENFNKIVSIELSEELWIKAAKRFETNSNVTILNGDSPARLAEIKAECQNQGVMYWLDAHWCESNATAGKMSQCPLINELKAIGQLNARSVILIDDARLFLAPPLAPHEISHWPDFHQIVVTLLSLSSNHEVMVINDVIVYFPREARKNMQLYAQSHGVDWLAIAYRYKDRSRFIQDLRDKEEVINELSAAVNAYRAAFYAITQKLENAGDPYKLALEAKEKVIQEQSKAIQAYSSMMAPLFLIGRVKRRVYSIFRPRLGNLNQYQPRRLMIKSFDSLGIIENQPLISIVTPSFRQGAYIERTILSVLDQKYPNLEYFVQDGGSSDSTVDVLKSYQSRLSGWISEKDNGQSQAINLGLRKTSGEIMAWLNSDDLLLPGTLHAVADYFHRHQDVDVVYGNRLLIDENDMEIGRWIMPGHDSEILSWVDYIPQETMFWRRRIWDKVGSGVDESFRFAMDWDLLVRFRDAGAKFAHIPEFLGAFRIHEHQKTSAAINDIGHQEMDRIRERLLGKVPSRKELIKAIRGYLIKHIAIDMLYRVKVRLGVNS